MDEKDEHEYILYSINVHYCENYVIDLLNLHRCSQFAASALKKSVVVCHLGSMEKELMAF